MIKINEERFWIIFHFLMKSSSSFNLNVNILEGQNMLNEIREMYLIQFGQDIQCNCGGTEKNLKRINNLKSFLIRANNKIKSNKKN